MAFVTGFGGGAAAHANSSFADKRNGILSLQDTEGCGCIPLKKRPKKKSKLRLMKERIRQFSIWFFENEDVKEVEHVRRRMERKKKKKLINNHSGFRPLRWLYIFDVILWIFGSVFTLCSTVKAVGHYTTFYKSRDLYRILGPGILLAAVLVLFLATALKHRLNMKMDMPSRPFYIVQKTKKGSKFKTDIKDPDNDSGNEEDIEMADLSKKKEVRAATRKDTLKETNEYNMVDFFTQNSGQGRRTEGGYHKDTKYAKERRAWAKTKWMRMEPSSGDSSESDVELDVIKAYNLDQRDIEVNESRETHAELPSDLAKIPANRRITRFKPLSGGCFTAQSSIRSQTSEVSFASTISESAPLVRK